MVAGPLVDDIECTAVFEVARFGLGIVIGVGFFHERRFQLVALATVDKDGVGNHHLGHFIEGRCLGKHLFAEVIDGIRSSVAKTKYGIDFLLGLADSSVVEHSQRVGDAQWRNDLAPLVLCSAEKVEGEVVVVADQLSLGIGQLDVSSWVVVSFGLFFAAY